MPLLDLLSLEAMVSSLAILPIYRLEIEVSALNSLKNEAKISSANSMKILRL